MLKTSLSFLFLLLAVSPTLLVAGGTAEPAPRPTALDALVRVNWAHLRLRAANVCSDAVFLRRVYLDVIGTLPTAEEARAFIQDANPRKRQLLIDAVLEREEFADYWATKWCDILRVKAEFPVNLWPNAAQAYHRWVRTAIKENKPYDRFAREMLTASGSNFRVAEANFYRAVQNREPRGLAQAVALTFMGARADKWPQDQLDAMAVFFAQVGYKSTSEWKEEIVFNDLARAATQLAERVATLPDGTTVTLAANGDPREAFADWLISPTNAWFARNAVNRTWFWLLGRGIVHEPDDFRADNAPSNAALLRYLERQLIAARYDLRHLYRLILNSRTYQLASITDIHGTNEDPAAHFAAYPLRRLEAEVLADALCQITGTTERYSSPIPEPFTFIPEGMRSIELPDASISSSFLELFGRPGRDTGLLLERNDRLTSAQRLHLLNSTHVQRKLEQGPRLQPLFRARGDAKNAVTELYLTILSRFPTDDELKVAERYLRDGSPAPQRREAMIDLAWALINSTEFLYRH